MTPSPTVPAASQADARSLIAALTPSQRLRGLFVIANAQLGRTRQDKPFLKCLLSDRTGEAPARMWNCDEQLFKILPTDGFVHIEGEAQSYQNQLQIIIHNIEPADPSPEELKDLVPVTDRDIEQMFAEVKDLLLSMEHPAMRALAELFLEDEFFIDHFKKAPAAKALHHAHLGGLLEHTWTLMQIADRITPLYPRVSRDLVIMGCFLQDIGKTRELTWERGFAYTDQGELIGHIVEGTHMLRDKAQQLIRDKGVRLPPGAGMLLEHIILSHHGVPEYGAAKVPMSPEAVLVSHIDALDAKTIIARDHARPTSTDDNQGHSTEGFTEKSWALGTKLYRNNPLA